MVLKEYTFLFVVGTLFAFLDAWNIGTFPNSPCDLETP